MPRRLEALGLAALAGLVIGCREAPGEPFDCQCTYLTDTDDEGRQTERVCAHSEARAAAIAKGCAARGAPAPVQGCACVKASGVVACVTGDCLSPGR